MVEQIGNLYREWKLHVKRNEMEILKPKNII